MNKEERGHFFDIGSKYLIRSVTFSYLGRLKAVGDKEILIDDASWVADTGRFYNTLENGIFNELSSEIEPYTDDVILGRNAIVDMVKYEHELPKDQK